MSLGRRNMVGAVLLAVALVGAACSSTDGEVETTTSTEAVSTTTSAAPTTTTTEALPDGVFIGADGVETLVDDTTRIVSLTGDITEIIYRLGLGDRIVGVDITTTFPEEAIALKKDGGIVGFGQALSAEGVLRFAPTLVLGDESIEPQSSIQQLRDAGVPVLIIPYHTTLDGVGEKIRLIAEVLGVDQEGEALAGEVMGRIAEAQVAAAAHSFRPKVVYLYSRGPSLLFVFGLGIPTNAMIEGAGGADVGAALGEGAIPLTPEALVAAAPDVIVLPESGVEGLGGLDKVLAIPGVSDTPAGQAGAFLVYDEAYFFNLGPRAGEALNEFVEDLYAIVSP